MSEERVKLILELAEKYSGVIYGEFVKTLVEWETKRNFYSLGTVKDTDDNIARIKILFLDIVNQQNFISEYEGIEFPEVIKNYTNKWYVFVKDNIRLTINTSKKTIQEFFINRNLGFMECSLYFHNSSFRSSHTYRNNFPTISYIKHNIREGVYTYLDINDNVNVRKCYHTYIQLIEFMYARQHCTFLYKNKIITSSNLAFLGNKILVVEDKKDLLDHFEELERERYVIKSALNLAIAEIEKLNDKLSAVPKHGDINIMLSEVLHDCNKNTETIRKLNAMARKSIESTQNRSQNN